MWIWSAPADEREFNRDVLVGMDMCFSETICQRFHTYIKLFLPEVDV